MGQRSPMHQRYQKGTGPKGQTRRSAASAKPKRDKSAAPVKVAAGKSTEKTTLKDRYREAMPATQHYKRLRRAWWVYLGIASVSLAASLLLGWEPVGSLLGDRAIPVSNALSMGALVLIAFSWYIDLRKLRPLIKSWQAMSVKEREALVLSEREPLEDKEQ